MLKQKAHNQGCKTKAGCKYFYSLSINFPD